MEQQRQHHDEDHQQGEPDGRVDEDVLHGRHEPVVLRRVGEVPEPGEAAAGLGEGELERIEHREDAEEDEEEQVGDDEGEPPPPVQAARTRDLHGGRAQGSRATLVVRGGGSAMVSCLRLSYPAALAAFASASPNGSNSELSESPATSFVTTVSDQTG